MSLRRTVNESTFAQAANNSLCRSLLVLQGGSLLLRIGNLSVQDVVLRLSPHLFFRFGERTKLILLFYNPGNSGFFNFNCCSNIPHRYCIVLT
ncbi:hypothetical protein CDAR_524731 [Caerostris darwini]|uniref:Uncharacterized protein n=1 Tax=Caerostris darwini TaxID=1538125 RepID=A0AAV4QX86_9ARAC|nr:hypothetical protein CDAR_524731 [Caerostris darwini]